MRVVKFGGSSVADAERLRAAGALLARLRGRGPVTAVVSAMAGVTDGLLRVADDALQGGAQWPGMLRALRGRHRATYRSLVGAVPDHFERQWVEVEREGAWLAALPRDVAARALDVARFSGWGERLAVGLLAAASITQGASAFALDDAPVLLNGRAEDLTPAPSALASRAWLLPRLAMPVKRGAIPILPGYIARDAEGRLTTLGRNGSDYSAAVIAAALGATSLTIYSDVAGIYTADPHVIPDARLLPALAYDEAARIASLGAKALHPRAVEPLASAAIPLELRSASTPEAPGTDTGPRERLTRQRARDAAWVVAARLVATSDAVEISAIRLPAWPERDDGCDCAVRIASDCIRAGLIPLTVARDELAFMAPRARANEAARSLHSALAGCSIRHTEVGLAAGA